ncbi:hypothetical protein AJ80_09156, partial [Polytolypa hystricis UAMH7299]
NWTTTYDGACTSCRTRKIRCGREKPQCSSCSRDQVECVYSSPPKRVNHVKVLCQNFDDIQTRLISMQGELSWLTETLKRSNIDDRRDFSSDRALPSRDVSSPSRYGDAAAAPSTTAGHMVRDCGTLIERYYGPWTLLALCRDFEADIASYIGEDNDEVVGLINKILLETIKTDEQDLGTKLGQLDASICLPPKQLLSVMLESFFKQADYNTDIFCRQTVYEAVERVYNEPLNPTSEPWALCFNLIILLTLGAEHPIHSDDHFVRPMLQAASAAARKPSFFMSPRLVNVQALALLSLLTQQYHTGDEALGQSLFAQACILAREAGLHQAGHSISRSSNLSAMEAEERQKVFGSLYIRDRYSATASGSLTWLPSGAPKGPIATSTSTATTHVGNTANRVDTQSKAHWELAKIQDELHCMLSSADVREMSPPERQAALRSLQQKLKAWARSHKVPSSARPNTVDEVLLHLAFLGTRIRVLQSDNFTGEDASSASAQVLYDTRLCCLLVATSCKPHPNRALTDRLDHMLSQAPCAFEGTLRPHYSSVSSSRSSRSSRASSRMPSSPSPSASSSSAGDAGQRTSPLTPPPSSSSSVKTPESATVPIHRVAHVFPNAAVFVLVRHILGIGTAARPSKNSPTAILNDEEQQDEARQDISLVEALLVTIHHEPSPEAFLKKLGSDPSSGKVGRILQHLVDIIHVVKGATGHGYANTGVLGSEFASDDEGDNNDEVMVAPKQLLEPSSLLMDPANDAMNMSNMNIYGSGNISPYQSSIPLMGSSQPHWGMPPDSLSSSSSVTPMLTTGNSMYAPSITPTPPTTIPDSPFDISQFLNQMGSASPVIWDGGQGQAELQLQQMAHDQPETTNRRSKKRPRVERQQSG